MVYGGKPSTGCYLCRKRKIKCDEAFPQCRNCVIYGKPCPGYRPDAIFRNETKKVEKLVKRTNKSPGSQQGSSPGRSSSSQPSESSPRSTTSVILLSSSNSSSSSSSNNNNYNNNKKINNSNNQGSSPLSLSRVEDSTWDDRAVCYFFDQYTTYDETDDCVSHLGFLPSLYALCKASTTDQDSIAPSCLREAVDAAALLSLGNKVQSSSLTIRARTSYGKALRALRQALKSRTEAAKDETFTAVVTLSIFEDITGERDGLTSPHTEGFQYLMKLRGERQLHDQRGRDLFNIAFTQTHIEILALGDKPRHNSEWIVGLLDHSDPVHRLMVTASKVSELLIEAASAARLQSIEGDIFAKMTVWIESGKVLDAELAEWSQNLPDFWLPLIVYSPAGEPFITYNRVSIGAIWNYYRAIRIVLGRLMLEIRRIKASIIQLFTGQPDAETCQDTGVIMEVIQEMITDVCRSIPFALGQIDALGKPVRRIDGKKGMRAFHGYSLLWPLWYVLTCGLATPEQIEKVRAVLGHVGSVLGIKLALKLAEQEFSFDAIASTPGKQLALPMEHMFNGS